jgi:alpha-beta hydrolase superfamily lysophospholipase
MLALKSTLMLAAAGYVAFVAFLYLAQRSMLYHPRSFHLAPAAAGLPATEETVTTSDGERVILWHAAPEDDKPVVIYFPGNAEIIAMRAEHHRALIADGIGLIALSYRGYMGSTGSPTEPGLLRDAEAAYQFAAARYPPDRIVLWGHSLGTGVAVALAAAYPIGKLILEAPFTSTADVAAREPVPEICTGR